MELSVVIPVFNEEQSLPLLKGRLDATLPTITTDYEVVFVDDGSSDHSRAMLEAFVVADRHCRVVVLSRNFGQEAAMAAGLAHARGGAVVFLDADLQDPPEVIGDLVRAWREGYDVVHARRDRRVGETWFKRVTAAAFYRVFRAVTDVELPLDCGNFRLLSRRAVDALLRLPEHSRYIGGLSAWIGFSQTVVTYARQPRTAGETKYRAAQLIHLAVDGITGFSTVPLTIASRLGAVVALTAVVIGIAAIVAKLLHATVPGWTSLAVLISFLGGAQLLSLGMLGQYIARIYDEVRQRPLYIVDKTLGGRTAEDMATVHPLRPGVR